MAHRVRTRYAPSPTGKMHVGNLRTALYAYLIAKHEGGDFLLRIEDTDQERFVEGATEIIYATLRSAGLLHDEGPDLGGPVGPYVQSERQKEGIYMKYALELVEKGEAYYCFCEKERLDSMREEKEALNEVFKYDKHCLNLTKEEIQNNLDNQLPFVIRQNNPIEGQTTFEDVIFGTISVNNEDLDDMVLIKSDGYPTYNFANVVDDHLMEITHVVRGNEYLSSSPKYNRLYEAFGWDVPIYVHCPLITDENHKKLSKRLNHASYEDLVDLGFLKEAIVNFVALLGWSPSSNQEIFTLEELVKCFDYKTINKAPAVFDMKKFAWMNSEYIKALDIDTFFSYAEPEIKKIISKDLDLKAIAALVQTRVESFKDISELVDFFEELPVYSVELYNHKKMKTNPENSLDNMKALLPVLENQEDWSFQGLHDRVMAFVEEMGLKNGLVLWPLRTILSGKAQTPGGAFDIASILGKTESLERIRIGLQKLEDYHNEVTR